jgi:predicted phage baseplate assembly protein
MIAFDVPADWAPSGPAHNGLVPYTIWCSTDRATFSAPPRLIRVVPNVALAAHEAARSLGVEEVQTQVSRWLPLPAMKLQLSDPAPPLEDSIQLRVRERDGNWHEWKAAFDLTRYGPADRVFVVDRLRRRLIFGDGLTGRIPLPDRSADPPLTLEYLGGGGEEGNLGANLFWTLPGLPEVSAINPLPARGGEESESAEMARARIAASLQVPERAITSGDFETLAIGTPGVAVARAHAAVGLHPSFPCAVTPGAVTVFIVPAVPRGANALAELWVPAPQPDPGMITEVLLRLDARRLITTEVFVRAPKYRRVSVKLRLAGDPAADTNLRPHIQRELTRYLDPLTGGEEGSGWPFGNPLRPSEIAGRVVRVVGEHATLEYLALQLDGDGPSSDCTDIAIGPHELVWLESLAVEWRPDSGKRGGLR